MLLTVCDKAPTWAGDRAATTAVIAGKQSNKEPADKEPAENQGYIIQRFCYVTLCPSLLYYNLQSQIPNRDNLLD